MEGTVHCDNWAMNGEQFMGCIIGTELKYLLDYTKQYMILH
jgi:hypothetical protein